MALYSALLSLLFLSALVFDAQTTYSSQLSEMIVYLTKRLSNDYQSHGCWCNVINRQDENKVVDETDRCCRLHSDCYKSITTSSCPSVTLAYDSNFRQGIVTCMDPGGTCEYGLCMCDKLVAECFQRHPQMSNTSKFHNLKKEQCQVTPNTLKNARWAQNGVTVAGGHGQGSGTNQLYAPYSLYVDDDQTVYIADFFNHRIVEWKSGATSGQVVVGGNGQGNRVDQLNLPTDVIVDKETDSLIICDQGNRRVMRWSRRNGTSGETIINNIYGLGLAMDDQRLLYIADAEKHEVKRYRLGETNGTLMAGGNGGGDLLNQLNYPTNVFVDRDQSIYISDHRNHRVMKWLKGAKEGIVVAGGRGEGSSLTQLNLPYGLFVDTLGTVYVADYGNHRVMRWYNGATQGDVIVGGTPGQQANQLFYPYGLSFDRHNNLYVVEYGNHRVQRFSIEQ